MVTRAVAVVIFVPPEAPTTILTLLCLSKIMVGHIEDRGLLPGPGQKQKRMIWRHYSITLSCVHQQFLV